MIHSNDFPSFFFSSFGSAPSSLSNRQKSVIAISAIAMSCLVIYCASKSSLTCKDRNSFKKIPDDHETKNRQNEPLKSNNTDKEGDSSVSTLVAEILNELVDRSIVESEQLSKDDGKAKTDKMEDAQGEISTDDTDNQTEKVMIQVLHSQRLFENDSQELVEGGSSPSPDFEIIVTSDLSSPLKEERPNILKQAIFKIYNLFPSWK